MTFDFEAWPPGAIAVFAAAAMAGFVALVNVVVTLVDGNVSRKKINDLVRREQWWTRWSWTIEKSLSKDAHDRFMGQAMMDALVDRPWLTDDDRQIALAIAKAIVKREEQAEAAAKKTPAGIFKGGVQAVTTRLRPGSEES